MKILFIDMYAVLGGVPVQLVNRFNGLKNKFECHFSFLYDYGGTYLFEGYEYVYILNNKDKLQQLINKYKYDVISIIDANIVYDWLSDIEYDGFIINEVHTTYEKNLDKLIQLKKNTKINLIITPSQYMKKIIEYKYEFKDLIPIEVVPNCLDFNNFNYIKKEYKDKTYKLIWVGRLDEHKRYNDFLDICLNLEANYKQYSFEYIIVGGVNSSESIVNNLIDKITKYNIVSKFKWYSSIEYKDMYKIYSQVKDSGGVYISTSSNESFGMTILESMAIDLPVVIPNVGALDELLEVNEYSYSLYELGNLKKACELIIGQLDRNPLYNLEKYSIDKYLEKFEYIINKYSI